MKKEVFNILRYIKWYMKTEIIFIFYEISKLGNK